MSKTLSELNDEDAYKLGDIYECTFSESSLYNEGDLYAVVEGFSGEIGIQINGNSKNICRKGDVEFKLVEPKVSDKSSENSTTFPRVEVTSSYYVRLLDGGGWNFTRSELEELQSVINEVLK